MKIPSEPRPGARRRHGAINPTGPKAHSQRGVDLRLSSAAPRFRHTPPMRITTRIPLCTLVLLLVIALAAKGARAETVLITGSNQGIGHRAFVTRQTTLPTSSATSSAPDRSTATPTGRPNALPSSLMKPDRISSGGPAGWPLAKGTKMTL